MKKYVSKMIILDFVMLAVLIMAAWSLMNTGKTSVEVAEPDVGWPSETALYDADIRTERLDAGGLMPGVKYSWKLEEYNDDGELVPMEADAATVSERGDYAMTLKLVNRTGKAMKNVKLYFLWPETADTREVVGDEMTVTACLEYQGSVARKQLDLVGESAPIAATMPGGSMAGRVSWNGGEAETLPAYDDDNPEAADMSMFQYWRQKGMTFDLPAGEKVAMRVGITAKEVYAIETSIGVYPEPEMNPEATAGNEQAWASALKMDVFHGQTKRVRVVAEVLAKADMTRPMRMWPGSSGSVELVPGSVTINDAPAADFVLREDALEDLQVYEPIDTGVVLRKGETLKMAYDVEVGANFEGRLARISCETYVGGTGATASAECDVRDVTLWVLITAAALICVVLYTIARYAEWRAEENC